MSIIPKGFNNMLKAKEAAAYVGFRTDYFYALLRKDGIPHYAVGGRVFFKPEDLDTWVEKKKKYKKGKK